MAKFLAIYIGTATAREKAEWDTMDAGRRQEMEADGMQAWGQWMADHRDIIVDNGTPLGKTRRISSEGISDVTNTMVGYVIVEAETHEAAASLFENHPHFAVFPGEAVEVMECLALPRR